ncbi:putative transcription initiation factor IIB-like protein [Tetrabaena socialis]|uniref:Putative transcription initiation factor IIB-like protein n=1 Tax=Tetrabaena socialis TaxID=47790 RepID=A0A2J8AEQ3_9CHLO|nr:putative transcription initiation factor IIB-like protein [Tetrabaena socialis]|eukprot:PNH10994.1 putative transcription initiation factor IIB-like protein [Tetrabaena socialis]
MTKGCKRFQDVMRMNLNSSEPEDFINRFGSKINMDPEMRELCKTVMKKADEIGALSENTPPSIAAGIMYLIIMTCKLNVSKQTLSEVCGISQVTICKCYKKLHVNRGKILPKEIIMKYGII